MDMTDYVETAMMHGPNLVILHTGTKDLRFSKSSSEIANNIIKLALKSRENRIVVSLMT